MLNKNEFVRFFKERAEIETLKEATAMVESVLETLKDAIVEKGGVNIADFGKFEVVETKERVGRNPKTGDELTIPAKRKVKFKAFTKLNEKL